MSKDDSNEIIEIQDFEPEKIKEFGNVGEFDHKGSPVRELIKLFEKICENKSTNTKIQTTSQKAYKG